MIAAITAVLSPHAPAGLPGEGLQGLRCDNRSRAIDRFLGALCVSPGLIADGLQFGNAVLQHRVGEVSDAVLDRVVKTLELRLSFGSFAQLGDMGGPALGTLLAAVEHGR